MSQQSDSISNDHIRMVHLRHGGTSYCKYVREVVAIDEATSSDVLNRKTALVDKFV